MADLIAEKFEKRIQEFERKRELFEREMMKIRDELKRTIDTLFDDVIKAVEPHTEETDLIVEGCIKDFKKLFNRKKELNMIKEKLSPVLEDLRSSAA